MSDANTIQQLKANLMRIQDVVQGLRLKNANEMHGPCPWCGGKDRFTVKIEPNEFFCRQCMTLEANNGHWHDVIDFHCKAEGTDIKGLKEKYLDRPDTPKGPKTETGRRVHVYHDEHVAPIYRKTIRSYSDRTKDAFFERYVDGQWLKGLAGVKQTLYGLPGLKTPGPVYLSESEKDADRLTELGLVASSFGGAENWRAEYAGLLAGREVVILAHHDEPGRKAAERAARALVAYGCMAKIIPGEIWGTAKGADVADWLSVGHTRDELQDLVEAAEVWKPGTASDHSGTVETSEPDPMDTWTPKVWPELNHKALYGLAGRAVELACRHSEADPAAVLATFLAWFGCEVGFYPGVKIGEAFHSPRLFTAIVGNSSKARKGTSAALVRAIREQLMEHGRVVSAASPGPLSSGEGLIYAVRDEVQTWVAPKKDRDGCMGVGYWAVTDPGVEDKRLHVIDEEFASALAAMKREGATLSTIMRGAWDHGNLSPLTKTSRIKATHAHLCITTHTTIEELKAKLEDVEAFNGFGNRFLWVCARRQRLVSRPKPMDEVELDLLCREIARKLEAINGQRIASFTAESWEVWDAVYPSLTRERDGFAGAMIQRAEAQVIRLAMVYAFTDGSITIEPRHLDAALAFWQYCEDSALYIFGGRAADTLTQKIVDLLKEGPLTAAGISKGLHHNIKADQIKNALGALTARKKIEVVRDDMTGGRPRTIFRLLVGNPNEKDERNEITPERETLISLNSFNSLGCREEIDEEALAERRAIQTEGGMV